MSRFVLAIDQGTTGSRAILIDADGRRVAEAYEPHAQLHPAPGWVEHDADEVLRAVEGVLGRVLATIRAEDVAAVGIANQRETIVIWDRATGRPIANAIVWQDARTAAACADLVASGAGDMVRAKTGLPIQPYFSATKLAWLLDHTPGARARAERGELAAGTMDSWLAWHLAGTHITDVTNASRTLLFDIDRLDWDDELLALFRVPRAILPAVEPTWGQCGPRVAGHFNGRDLDAPLLAIAGDQQAALLGQGCLARGDAKCTYGTGAFLLVNAGQERPANLVGLLVSPAYQQAGHPAQYAVEGAMAVAGRAVQWLRDELGLIESAEASAALAASVDTSGGVRFVPAHQGLFAPWWDADARGLISGLSLYSTKAHLVRAVLESLAFQTRAVLDAAQSAGISISTLQVDGGATRNSVLVQLLADVIGRPVSVSGDAEATVRGVAIAAGTAANVWTMDSALDAMRGPVHSVEPTNGSRDRWDAEYADWLLAVDRARR